MFPRICDGNGHKEREQMMQQKRFLIISRSKRVRGLYQFPQLSCLMSGFCTSLSLSAINPPYECSEGSQEEASVLKESATSASYYNLNFSFLKTTHLKCPSSLHYFPDYLANSEIHKAGTTYAEKENEYESNSIAHKPLNRARLFQ